MLNSMQWTRSMVRISTALVAAVIMIVVAPLHAAHNHHDDVASGVLHAPCAACQVDAPAGTPPVTCALVVKPDGVSHFVDVHRDALHPDPQCRVDACRAPPHLLAA